MKKPYHLFGISAFVLVLLSFIPFKSTVDMHVHDTYMVLDIAFVFRALAMFLMLEWMLYFFTIRILFSSVLIWLHVLITLGMLAVIFIASSFIEFQPVSDPVKFDEIDKWEAFKYSRQVYIVGASVVLLLLAQPIFVINLFLGVLKRTNTTNG
ncbi:MAG: hypothetical protein ACTHMM_11105 [Agriterribacter sp.]